MRRLPIVIALLVFASGCFHQRSVGQNRSAPAKIADPFRAAIGRGFVETATAAWSDRYTATRVTFPAHRSDRPKNARMGMTVRQPRTMPRGLIVVLPILGGDYGPSDTFAHTLAVAGFTTLRFDRKADIFDPERDFAHVATMMREGVIDVRRGLGWAIRERRGGRGGIGVLGLSMGSFVGTLVAATDRRIDAAVLALGGGGLPDILLGARSELEIGALYDALEARGLSEAEIQADAVRDLAEVEPLLFAPALDPITTLLVHARFDGVVPFRNGDRIWEAMQRPERIVLLTGHYSAIVTLPYLIASMTAHFERVLDPDVSGEFEPF